MRSEWGERTELTASLSRMHGLKKKKVERHL